MKHPPLLLSALLAIVAVAPLAAAEPSPTPPPASAAAPAYPLDSCVVSGEALGSMGDAYVHVHKEEGKPDREVRLCCKGCLKKFSKAPAKYIARLDAATKESSVAKPAAPAADSHGAHDH